MAEPPQYLIKAFERGGERWDERRISDFPHPYPTLKDLQKEIIRYTRPDGVDLTATLYLPPGGRTGARRGAGWWVVGYRRGRRLEGCVCLRA